MYVSVVTSVVTVFSDSSMVHRTLDSCSGKPREDRRDPPGPGGRPGGHGHGTKHIHMIYGIT